VSAKQSERMIQDVHWMRAFVALEEDACPSSPAAPAHTDRHHLPARPVRDHRGLVGPQTLLPAAARSAHGDMITGRRHAAGAGGICRGTVQITGCR
jgi:hypothetical protein